MKKYIVFLLALFCSTSVFALDFGTLKTLSRALARDPIPSNGSPRVSEVIVSSYVNIAQDEIAMFSWCNEAIATIPIVKGQREYNYVADMVAPERVALDGVLVPATSIAKLDQKDSTWQSAIATATPTQYYANPGLGVIGFDTYPDTTTDKNITVTYIQKPSPMINDSDIPFNGQTRLYPFHYTICLWVAAMICYQDNRGAEGDRYWTMYVDRVKNLTTTIRLSPDYAGSFSGK